MADITIHPDWSDPRQAELWSARIRHQQEIQAIEDKYNKPTDINIKREGYE